jgi:hypothetical protein
MPEKNFVMTPREIFQSLIGQLNHEDELLIYRTGWLLSTQFALFVGFFTIDPEKLPKFLQNYYVKVICGIGTLSTIFIFLSVLASLIVFVELRTKIHAFGEAMARSLRGTGDAQFAQSRHRFWAARPCLSIHNHSLHLGFSYHLELILASHCHLQRWSTPSVRTRKIEPTVLSWHF